MMSVDTIHLESADREIVHFDGLHPSGCGIARCIASDMDDILDTFISPPTAG